MLLKGNLFKYSFVQNIFHLANASFPNPLFWKFNSILSFKYFFLTDLLHDSLTEQQSVLLTIRHHSEKETPIFDPKRKQFPFTTLNLWKVKN